MTTVVRRYRCDLCGKLHMLESLATICEQMDEIEILDNLDHPQPLTPKDQKQ